MPRPLSRGNPVKGILKSGTSSDIIFISGVTTLLLTKIICGAISNLTKYQEDQNKEAIQGRIKVTWSFTFNINSIDIFLDQKISSVKVMMKMK